MRRPRPGWVLTRRLPRTLSDHVLHHVQADAAAGDFGDILLEGEARQEEKLEQLGLGELLGHVAGVASRLRHDRLAHALQLDAGAVVGDRDQQHAGAVARFEANRAFGGLPARSRCSRVSQP